MSQKTERCPKCMGILEDDGSCSCGFRKATVKPAAQPDMCSWSDMGRMCPCRGIINTGKWYCREHWARVNKLEPDGVGNALPEHAKRADESMIDYLKRVPRESRHRSADVKQWDDWKYNPKTKRLERRVELDMEEIPEEVGQA